MSEILFATTNQGKLREVRALAQQFGVNIIGLKERTDGIDVPEVEETGTTYLFNCRLKAVAYQEMFNCPVLVDDSGIEVDALDGRPGVDAAVYAGKGKSSAEHIQKVWTELRAKNVNENAAGATMVTCAIVWDGTIEQVSYGKMRGRIVFEKRGLGGFGYDSIFIPEGQHETVSEIKDKLGTFETHRAKAMRELFSKLA